MRSDGDHFKICCMFMEDKIWGTKASVLSLVPTFASFVFKDFIKHEGDKGRNEGHKGVKTIINIKPYCR